MSTEDRHVLVVAKDFPPTPGGVETYSAEVARAYLASGWRVTVLTQHAEGNAEVDGSAYGATPYDVLRVARGSQLSVAARLNRALVGLRRHERFDLVHATTWRVAAPAALVLRRVPLVLSVHGREVLHFPKPAGAVLRWTLARADTVVAVSPSTARLLVSQGLVDDLARVQVRWNGITWPDLARRAPERTATSGPLRVMSLARLVPRKNVDKCLLAISDLVREGVDVRYTVGGRGPELERLKAMAAELLPPEVVTFAGYVPDADLPGLYAEHDVFLHPHSHQAEADEFEGFGIVIADAMSFGCAVVVGRDGGPGDYVEDGVTGLLVDGDDTAAIGSALRALAADPELRVRIASEGRDFALTHFDWAAHVDAPE